MSRIVLAVGSLNPTKLESVRTAAEQYWPSSEGHTVELLGHSVPSGVSDQPKSAAECIEGAQNRARAALRAAATSGQLASPTPSTLVFGVGLEGGIEQIGPRWFECGWIAVVRLTEVKTDDDMVLTEDDHVGLGSSARFQLGDGIVQQLLQGKELSEVMDSMTGLEDVRSGLGAMGVVTRARLGRAACYVHGVLFALAPFAGADRAYFT